MSLKAELTILKPQILLFYFLPLTIFYTLTFTISTLIGRYFFDYKNRIALVFGTGMRHLAISLAVAMTAFGDDGAKVAMIISVAFIFQTKIGAWYAHFSPKILGGKTCS